VPLAGRRRIGDVAVRDRYVEHSMARATVGTLQNVLR
jgi:hypothetical protein